MEKIIINGFFGKGNCGDEAILQTWVDNLSEKYKIVASIDSNLISCNNEYKKYDLYKEIDVIQNRRVDIFCQDDIKGYIIGGGGLGLGFGVEQWIHAILRDKKTFYLGTIVHDEFFDNEKIIEINKNFFNSFEMISVRDSISQKNLKNIFNIESYFYPDIVFALKSEKIDLVYEDYITVTIRSSSVNDLEKTLIWLDKVKKFAKEKNYKIIYLPFDKSDELFMKNINLEISYQSIYWFPKKTKYIIENSKMVFSLGRYHPLIFAMSSGVSCYYLECRSTNEIIKDKCYYLFEDFSVSENYLINTETNTQFIENTKAFKDIQKLVTSQMDDFFKKLNERL